MILSIKIKQKIKMEKIIPRLLDRKDMTINKHKSILNIKDIISTKIRTLKGLIEEQKLFQENKI